MRETNFIKQKKDNWIELERTMRSTQPEPEKLNDLFVQITDDLSYSRTFYPNRSVRVYLNGLAQQIFYSIYKNRRTTRGGFLSFWSKGLPGIMYRSRYELFLGMLLFWVPFIVGVLSGLMGEDGEFARMLMGDDYIEMTINNIESGDPMGVYKDDGIFTMFTYLFLNNLLVSFRYFALGVFLTMGSVVSLVFFGMYVGAFQFFFWEQGELVPSILGIWTHGSVEIPAAILAGVAGIVMGKGLVFPGTYSRMQAFVITAKKGVKIMIGVIPMILFAAFLEAFITRLTDTPDILRGSFITFNLCWILWYFLIRPYRLNTMNFDKHLPLIAITAAISAGGLFGALFLMGVEGAWLFGMIGFPVAMFIVIMAYEVFGLFQEMPDVEEEEEQLQPEREGALRFDLIKTAGEIFKDTFVVYGKNLGRNIGTAFATAGIFLGLVLLLGNGEPSDLFTFPAFELRSIQESPFGFLGMFFSFLFDGGIVDVVKSFLQFFNYDGAFLSPFFFANTLVYSLLAYISLRALKTSYVLSNPSETLKTGFWTQAGDFMKVLVPIGGMNVLLAMGNLNGFFIFLLFLTIPIFLFWTAVMVLEDKNPFTALGRTFNLFFTRMGNSIGLYLLLGLITFMVFLLIYSPALLFVLQNFGFNVATEQEGMDQLLVVCLAFSAQVLFGLMFPLVTMGFGLLYYSQVEIRDAKSLFEKVSRIGTGKRLRGLEREG